LEFDLLAKRGVLQVEAGGCGADSIAARIRERHRKLVERFLELPDRAGLIEVQINALDRSGALDLGSLGDRIRDLRLGADSVFRLGLRLERFERRDLA